MAQRLQKEPLMVCKYLSTEYVPPEMDYHYLIPLITQVGAWSMELHQY